MWPFGRKNDEPDEPAAPEAPEAPGAPGEAAAAEPAEPAPQAPAAGPFDVGEVSPEGFDFSDFAKAKLNLGSILLPVPRVGDVQVEMGPKGPTMLHLITPAGRITPVAFAAPTSGGQWAKAAAEIRDGLAEDQLEVAEVAGPWGTEIYGTREGIAMRVIGVDGPRWMLRMTLSGPVDKAEELAEIGRGVVARTFVSRGDNPMPAGQPLPVTLPPEMARQIREAYEAQQRQQAGDGSAPGAAGQ